MLTLNKKKSSSTPYLWMAGAILLFGLSTPVLKALVTRGGHFGTMFENAISYCNVLFVGNLCSAGIALAIARPSRLAQQTWWLVRRRPAALAINVLLANVLAPTLIITALEHASTTVVILVLQTDAVFMMLVGSAYRRERPSTACFAGNALVGVGVLVLGLASGGFSKGFLYTLAAAACRATGNVSAKVALDEPSVLPAFLILRNLSGAVIFFYLAVSMFGPQHFAEAFSPGLWPLMIVYAGLIVLLGQVSWYRAVTQLPADAVATAWTLTPVVSLAFVYLLLGETPSGVQWVSIALVLLGLVISVRGSRKGPSDEREEDAGTTLLAAPGAERTLAGAN